MGRETEARIAAFEDRSADTLSKLLDPPVVRVGNVDRTGSIHCHAGGKRELAVAGPERAPLCYEGSVLCELLEAIQIAVGDVDVTGRVGSHTPGQIELTVSFTRTSPGGD